MEFGLGEISIFQPLVRLRGRDSSDYQTHTRAGIAAHYNATGKRRLYSVSIPNPTKLIEEVRQRKDCTLKVRLPYALYLARDGH